jgi:hypothetical protein
MSYNSGKAMPPDASIPAAADALQSAGEHGGYLPCSGPGSSFPSLNITSLRRHQSSGETAAMERPPAAGPFAPTRQSSLRWAKPA